MKRNARTLPLLLILFAAAALTALAAGGDSADPLLSLSHLRGAFSSTVDARVEEKLTASDQALLSAAEGKGGSTGVCAADAWQEAMLKRGDVLSGGTGLNVTVLSGGVQVTFSSGAVVDVTAGSAVPSGTTLTVNHRYLTAEDTSASFTAVSRTAVADYMGYYTLNRSDATDYNAMASALKAMHLFRGSFTGYGSGYDLELAPTRLQALIMFLRVLGEEDAALSHAASAPFSDIAAGTDAARYVGYAFEKGYTNGYTAKLWKPAGAVNVYQYTEFILRALGESSSANTDLSDTMERAAACSLLTADEASALKGITFLRADLVYISYYALDAAVAGTGATLRQTLLEKGVFTAAEASAASLLVTGGRGL